MGTIGTGLGIKKDGPLLYPALRMLWMSDLSELDGGASSVLTDAVRTVTPLVRL